MSLGTGTEKEEEVLDLEHNNQQQTPPNASNSSNSNARTETKTESKKTKVSVEFDPQILEEIKVLTTLGVCESRESFIIEAVTEKKDAVLEKLRNTIRKK
jgi:hypothetical protein